MRLLVPVCVVLCACSSPERARHESDSSSPPAPAESRAETPAVEETPAADAGAHPDPSAAPAHLDPREDPAFTVGTTRGGKFTVAWRALGGTVPKNEPFELEVWVYADNRPLPGVALVASGWMPDHGHGMVRMPRTEDRGDGSYHVSGMLFHMRGHWKLQFDIVDETYSERAEFALDIR